MNKKLVTIMRGLGERLDIYKLWQRVAPRSIDHRTHKISIHEHSGKRLRSLPERALETLVPASLVCPRKLST